MKKVIVFGGSGFLGSHVADALDKAGYKVSIFDIKKSPYVLPSQIMIVGDILDQDAVDEAVSGASIVYNFAGVADIEEANNNPLDTVKKNVLGNTILLDACRKNKVERFVYASSLYVYSKAGAFYRSSKQACELLIGNYEEVFGLPYTILRFGSLYGPRSDERNFIHSVIKQAFRENKITRFGDGEELREYIHVLDAASSSVDILSDDFKNQQVIISGIQQVRVRDLLMMLKEILDNKILVEFLPPNYSEHYEITPYTFRPRIAKKLMGKTFIDLSQGILDMVYELHNGDQRGDSLKKLSSSNK